MRSLVSLCYEWFGRNLCVVVAATVLLLAGLLGSWASARWLILLGAVVGAALMLRQPHLGLSGLVLIALVIPLEFGTGTQVSINPSVVYVPLLTGVWGLTVVMRRGAKLAPAAVNRPLLLFLGASLLSLAMGNVLWAPEVPRPDNVLLVQVGQWGVFVLSACAFWLAANLIRESRQLVRLMLLFVVLGGVLVVLRLLPGGGGIIGRFTTVAFIRAPFWICLVALAGGQFLFHRQLGWVSRLGLVGIVLAVLYYSLVTSRESISTWTPALLALGMLLWLRFAHLRWPMLVVGLAVLLLFFPTLYEFAGGDAEWILAGAPRFELMRRVVEVTMRNPLFGLGPASYRAYARVTPLRYRQAFWLDPNVSSHNNYVDIFAHNGLVGLGLFIWFLVELGRLGWRLSQCRRDGFLGGYVNGMLAAFVALLFAMLLADWFLPFVYNIGFPGFQASVLAWMFLGGLVAVDRFEEVDGSVDRHRQLEHA